MTHFKTTVMSVLVACAVLAAPMVASAEIIASWVPTSHDYGNVTVGESESQIFTVTVGTGNLAFIGATLVANDNTQGEPEPYMGASFAITASPNPYDSFPAPLSFDIEVTFAPDVEGYHYAYLRIQSDDVMQNEDIRIPLFGMGVASEPEPVGDMAALIALFEAYVADGTVVGDGPGSSAGGRLNAFRNMLNAAADLLEEGYLDQACETLSVAYYKCDGAAPPPDFISGPNAPTINAAIDAVMDALGCP